MLELTVCECHFSYFRRGGFKEDTSGLRIGILWGPERLVSEMLCCRFWCFTSRAEQAVKEGYAAKKLWQKHLPTKLPRFIFIHLDQTKAVCIFLESNQTSVPTFIKPFKCLISCKFEVFERGQVLSHHHH